jgi:hypothetical protein
MRRFWTVLALGAPVSVALLLFTAAQAAAPEKTALLGILSEWQYPGSRMLGGASMSDGGTPLIQAVKCQAILTTTDPIEKVIAFYAKKAATSPAPGRQDAKAEVKETEASAVSTQDDSEGRPITLRVFVVHKVDTSTTLVISRAKDEKVTHIAWSHFLRLEGKR